MYNVNSIDVSFHILCQFALKSDQNIWKKKEKFLFFLNDVKKFKTSIKTTRHSALLVIFSGAKKKKIKFSRQHFSVQNI